ncbi:MAG: hypothetical protein NXI29_25820 [bacterium]|nr:hypothetical protein [bacterium]
MNTVLRKNTEVMHRFVFELRYDLGQIYWDRAGQIAKDIISVDDNAWDLDSIGLETCKLSCSDLNLHFAFGPNKLDLSQSQNAETLELLSIGDFCRIAESLSEKVISTLELSSFLRFGFRVWNLYPTDTRDEAITAVKDLKLFSYDQEILKSLGEEISDISHRLVFDRMSHMLRIAVTPFEQEVKLQPSVLRKAKERARDHPKDQKQVLIDQQKAKKMISRLPQFGLLLDLDAYIDDPPYPDDISISDFIGRTFEDFENVKSPILTSND